MGTISYFENMNGHGQYMKWWRFSNSSDTTVPNINRNTHIKTTLFYKYNRGSSWSWSYGSWIYNYLCNQCLSPLKMWVRISFRARCTRYNIMW